MQQHILLMAAMAVLAGGRIPAEAAPAKAPPPPPTVGGVYIDKGACPGEGCAMSGKIQALAPVKLYDRPAPAASVIGQLATNEWVEVVQTEAHVTPVRGVVKQSHKLPRELIKGDVVYLLTAQGEGCYDLWRKGATLDWCDPESMGPEYAQIDWAPPPKGSIPLVFWVRVKRPTGATGWIRDQDNIRCGGQMDREGCPALNE